MLTKGRLAQLLFMLAVLLVLFFWKTFDINDDKKDSQANKEMSQQSLLRCDYLDGCEFITEQGTFLLNVKNLPIKAEQWIDFELFVPHKNIQVSKAQIVGKNMFMGRIPITFKKTTEQHFSGRTMVGACTDTQMIWSLEISVDNGKLQELLSFDFMVKR